MVSGRKPLRMPDELRKVSHGTGIWRLCFHGGCACKIEDASLALATRRDFPKLDAHFLY